MATEWTTRFRKTVGNVAVWLLLLAVGLPSYASLVGACCRAAANVSSCCADSMKMPGMPSSEISSGGMGSSDEMSMASARMSADDASVQCEGPTAVKLPQFTDAGENSDDRQVLAGSGEATVSIAAVYTGLSSAETPVFDSLQRSTPPPPFDPLSVSLRI